MSIAHSVSAGPVRQALRSAMLVTGLAVVAVLGTAGPATAAPAAAPTTTIAATCPAGALCLYEGTNYTGEMFAVTSFNPGGSCVSLVDHGWGDRAHSAVNTHSNSAAMFSNDDCLGGPFQVPGNSSLPSFGSFTPESVWVPSRLS